MVIGIDGSRAFLSKKTGTENYSYQLIKALAKLDKLNKYIIFIRPGVILEKFPSNFQFVNVSWPRLWTQGGLALKTFSQKLDVLFIPSHTLPIIRKPGLKTVVTVHDLGSEYLPKYHQLKQRVYLSLMQKHQLKTATKIIAVSKATKEDLVKRRNIDPKKVEVVYEGYNQKLFKPRRVDTEVDSLMPYFLFVGTVQPRKNLERVIKAFHRFLSLRAPKGRGNLKTRLLRRFAPRNDNGIELVIAGSKGWLSDEIYKLPKKLGIEKRVKFLGYVPDEKLPALYSNAEALVFPSLFEGFGLPILEAQACGCPVITSDVGSSPNNISSMHEVGGKGALYVDPYSIESIVNAMKKMEDRKWRMEMIKKGFENVKRFSWEKAAKETLKVLESV